MKLKRVLSSTLVIFSLSAHSIVGMAGVQADSLSSSGTSVLPKLPSNLQLPKSYLGPFEQGVDGVTRKSAKVFLPKNYDAKETWPVVVLLHGFTGTAETEDLYLAMRYRVSRRGFILVVPEGTVNSEGKNFWNATEHCCDFDKSGIDDAGYLKKVIQNVQANYKVDAKRVYLFGHSNGGFMANRLACEPENRFAGIAVLAGGAFKNAADCKNQQPTRYLQIHAVNDSVIAYDTDLRYASGQETVQQWVDRNKCAGPSVQKPAQNFVLQITKTDTEVQAWPSCEGSHTVELWTIKSQDETKKYNPHVPLFHFRFVEAALTFLFAGQPSAK